MTTLISKRGDTLTLTATRTDSAGAVVDVSSLTISADLKRRGETIALTVEKTDPVNGEITLNATAAATALWDVGVYRGDIQYTDGSEISSTTTFLLDIQEDITGAS